MGLCAVYNYDLLRAPCVHITIMQHYKPWLNLQSVDSFKSDRATKIIVTLLFNDGFQKCKNSFKANEILFGKNTICAISSNFYS